MLDLTFVRGTLIADEGVDAYVCSVGALPGGVSFAYYGRAVDVLEGDVAEFAEGDGVDVTGVRSVLATRYARPTETGDYVLAHLAFERKGRTFDTLGPRDLVVVSRVGTDTVARYCGHDACIERLGGKHIPDRIDKVGATYCKGREGDGDATRRDRKDATPVERGHRYLTQREYAATVAVEGADVA